MEGRWGDAARFLFPGPGAHAGSSWRRMLRLAKSLAPRWVRHLHDTLRWKRTPKPSWMVDRAWDEWRSQAGPVVAPASLPASPAAAAMGRADQRPPRILDRMVTAICHAQGNRASLPVHGLGPGRRSRSPFRRGTGRRLGRSSDSTEVRSPISCLPRVEQRRGKTNASDVLANRVRRQLPRHPAPVRFRLIGWLAAMWTGSPRQKPSPHSNVHRRLRFGPLGPSGESPHLRLGFRLFRVIVRARERRRHGRRTLGERSPHHLWLLMKPRALTPIGNLGTSLPAAPACRVRTMPPLPFPVAIRPAIRCGPE